MALANGASAGFHAGAERENGRVNMIFQFTKQDSKAGRNNKKVLLCASACLFLLTGCQAAAPAAPTITPTPFTGSRRVELGDITMYFEARGSGEPLILIHGGFGCTNVWVNQIPEFSEHYYVIAPDSRGHGRTTDSDAPISYHRMAEDVIRLMDYLGIKSAYIVGWSDGGVIGIDLAIHHPERVKALVAYAAAISPDGNQPGFVEFVRTVTVSELKSWLASAYQPLGVDYLQLMPDPDRLPIILEKIRTMWLTEPTFTPEELAGIQVPTLIMDGQLDDVVRPDHAQVIAKAIPNARVSILSNTGHYAVLEESEVWNKAVLDFLENK
jgi:pimeloyl-ACP methyl ester carboxylesterase